MPSQDQLKEIFNLYDEELDGKIDGTQIGDVVRAAGLKPTNAMVTKASGQEFKRKGEKRITFEEWLPIYEQLSKEKARLSLFSSRRFSLFLFFPILFATIGIHHPPLFFR
ncbi:hypothetical protein OESDEN_07693 [Oesophagostomum dentatum]|uniref:EF-hand domain-containing protein n=2 Tax=Oesophagostomum dentatum TaxID=61180 RepID=A0A0B1TAL0_OESDE|nr:hypothetical protein OESDEN_07693 [Oesophagostomum dentatum]